MQTQTFRLDPAPLTHFPAVQWNSWSIYGSPAVSQPSGLCALTVGRKYESLRGSRLNLQLVCTGFGDSVSRHLWMITPTVPHEHLLVLLTTLPEPTLRIWPVNKLEITEPAKRAPLMLGFETTPFARCTGDGQFLNPWTDQPQSGVWFADGLVLDHNYSLNLERRSFDLFHDWDRTVASMPHSRTTVEVTNRVLEAA